MTPLIAMIALWGAPEAAEAPSSAPALMAAAERARAAQDLAGALDLARRAHALDPSPAILHNVAVLLEALGRYREAEPAFRAVSADARAPADIRARDLARADALTEKLPLAHLVLTSTGARGRVFVDGRLAGVGEETPLAPGAHWLELERGAAGVALLRVDLPAGERAVVSADRTPRALVTTVGVRPPVEALEIDGHRLRTAPPRDRVWVEPGAHQVRARPFGGAWAAHAITLTAGQVWSLGEHTAAMAAPVAAAAPPSAARGVSPWPWVLASVAVAAAGGGTALWVSASSDRATVRDAARDDSGVVIGLTYARAGQLEARADVTASMGTAALGVAALSAAGALAWWWWGGEP